MLTSENVENWIVHPPEITYRVIRNGFLGQDMFFELIEQ